MKNNHLASAYEIVNNIAKKNVTHIIEKQMDKILQENENLITL